jgi:hypothetical protein
MSQIILKCTRRFLIAGAFFLLVLLSCSVHSMAEQVLLTPPGLRSVKDPSLVVPADYLYPNKLIKLPVYRDASGKPAHGWSGKFIDTRRFVSNESAWIFFRDSDMQQSVVVERENANWPFRFWPVGTTMVVESYKGNALQKKNSELTEIAVMSKTNRIGGSASRIFYPVNWTYARFNPDGSPAITSAKVRDCHQCHSIAFHFTGDLIFTRFK